MTHNRLVQTARDIALHEHALQTYPPRKGPIQFSMHLGHAVSVLERYRIDDQVIHAATWLHDLLEDTRVTAEELGVRLLAQGVGSFSARDTVDIVVAVTDEPGETREIRKKATYPKIRQAGWQAVTVKLADRIANVEASLLGGRGHDFLSRYRTEHPAFVEALYGVPDVDHALWTYLCTLIRESA